MLEEKTIVDQITILEYGQMEIRTATVVLRDGEEIARTFHRHVLAPGDDIDVEDPRVAAIARVDHTPERIAAYRDKFPGNP